MIQNPRILFASGLVVAAGLLSSSCSTTQGQALKASFLPPAPKKASFLEASIEPPRVESNPFLKDAPTWHAQGAALPKPTEVDFRLKAAEDRFALGKRAYQEGRFEDARKDFNRAIDILLATPANAPDRIRVEARLQKLVDAVYRYDVGGLGAGESEDQVAYDKSPLGGLLEMTFPVDRGLKSKVLAEIAATCSQLPLQVTDPVLAYINFFSSEKGRRVVQAGLKRAGRYRPMIERILAEEGVPLELIHLAQAESGFLPRAVSWAAAVGMWQFVQFRGREYGLMQSAFHDDRLDPEKATRAAARHLKDLYTQFGDWYLAMAAYNCGPGCVDRAVQRSGYADFWKLRSMNLLPRETSNYVPLIVAMTIVSKNLKDYGIEEVTPDAALEYESYRLTASTSLALLADAADRTIPELRELNPSLLKNVAPAGFDVRLPKGSLDSVAALLESVPAAQRASARLHRVERGETLATIASRYRMPPQHLSSSNDGGALTPGDVIVVPAYYQPAPKTKLRNAAASKRAPARPTVVRKTPSRVASAGAGK